MKLIRWVRQIQRFVARFETVRDAKFSVRLCVAAALASGTAAVLRGLELDHVAQAIFQGLHYLVILVFCWDLVTSLIRRHPPN